jgi:hypothetical protein
VDNSSTPSRQRATPQEGNISADNLLASAISGDNVNKESGGSSSLPIIPLASFVFIGASAGAVYFIRQNKAISGKADDFQILDE